MEVLRKWARNEIERAKERTKEEWQLKTYDVALNAYERALTEIEAVPGCNVRRVAEYLKRLLNGYPLTAITDDPDEWEGTPPNQNDPEYIRYYQAKRRPSLYKNVYNGKTTYIDTDRYERIDMETFSYVPAGFCASVMDTIMPIEMPYFPYGVITIYTEEFKRGDDTYLGISDAREASGLVRHINMFFRISDDPENKEKEIKMITKKEFVSNHPSWIAEDDQNG